MAVQKKKGGKRKGGMRKRGRMKLWCEAYRKRGQREKNKAARADRHRANHPNDRG